MKRTILTNAKTRDKHYDFLYQRKQKEVSHSIGIIQKLLVEHEKAFKSAETGRMRYMHDLNKIMTSLNYVSFDIEELIYQNRKRDSQQSNNI